jgi:protein-S-isoprenylcysteine O-methyltransferase Ste14
MKPLLHLDARLEIGDWLNRYRHWALLPLIAAGLLFNYRLIPTQRSNYMLIAGAIGILFGSLLRLVSYKFMGDRERKDAASGGTLVTDGPYAITRNPVHLAEASIALGIAMMSRMPWLVLLTLLFGLIVGAFIIEWEEHFLRLRFGINFDDYCRTVPRWFSWRRFFHSDSYTKTRGQVKLFKAIRAEGPTLLIGLLAILAFLAKADIELLW